MGRRKSLVAALVFCQRAAGDMVSLLFSSPPFCAVRP